MEKILVDDSTCIGCGACIAIDSEHFDFNDEGKSSVISNENLKSNNLSNAIESCPVAAISIVDNEDSCNCDEKCECNCQEEQECNCEDCNCENCHCN